MYINFGNFMNRIIFVRHMNLSVANSKPYAIYKLRKTGSLTFGFKIRYYICESLSNVTRKFIDINLMLLKFLLY